MRRRANIEALIAALLLGTWVAAPAVAQDESEEARDPRTVAAEHFDRGITFFNEERYDAALAEFARAHELAPAHQTLYNLARVHAALGHAVEAAEAYAQYLEEAGDAIPRRRRREAEQALEEQRSRIGTLRVAADVEGATVAIDGVDVATTPLAEPLRLSAGAHTVELRAPGRETVRRAVTIAGLAESELSVELREEVVPRGTLRVSASIPDVAIAVDGEPIGVTPLASTVPLRAGVHEVTARRPGYLSEARRVEIEEGAEAEVRFEMRRDPEPDPNEIGVLRLRLPNAPFLIRIDGEAMLSSEEIEVPRGPHDVTVEVTDRQPYSGTVRVPSGSAILVVPPLAWTLEARRTRLESAAERRVIGWSVGVAGAGVAAVGLAVLIWNETEIAATDSRVVEINEVLMGECTMGWNTRCETLQMEGMQLERDQDTQNVLRGVTIAGTLLGAAVGGVGFGLALTTPSDDEIDAAARARATLRIGPAGVGVDGTF